MQLSELSPIVGSFACGAIAAGAILRPGLNRRAVQILGASGLTGMVVAVASTFLLNAIGQPVVKKINSVLDKDQDETLRVSLITAFYGAFVLTNTVAITALARHMGIAVPYKTAAAVTTASFVGLVSGFQLS